MTEVQATLAAAARGVHGGTAGGRGDPQGPAGARDRDGVGSRRPVLRRAVGGFRASQPRPVDADRHRRIGRAAAPRDQERGPLDEARQAAGAVPFGAAGRARLGGISAKGRDRRHRAVEFPGEPHHGAAGGDFRGGKPGDGEDQRVHAGDRGVVRGDRGPVFRTRGTGVRQRRAGGGQGVCGAGVRSSAVHRRDRDRPPHPPRRGGQSDAGDAGTGRQIAGHHRQGREPGAGDRAGGAGQDA